MSNPTPAALFKQALSLNEKDRARLAGLLFESLENTQDIDNEALWQEEVAQRLAEWESGEVQGLSWEETKFRLLKSQDDAPDD